MKQLHVLITTVMLAAALISPFAHAETGTVAPPVTGIPESERVKFDLNAVTEEELISLRGIGPVLAHRIIELRAQKNGFDNMDELRQVQGIGAHNLSRFREHLYLAPPSPKEASINPSSQ